LDKDLQTGGALVTAPTIATVSPLTGPALGYIEVVITGTNFTAASAVTFGGTAATFTIVDDNTINANLPPHAAGVVSVTVTNPDGVATAAAAFTYTPTTDLEMTIQQMSDLANAAKATIGISIAYPNLPASLSTLPAMCFFVGPQTYDPYKDSEDIKVEKTTVFVRVHVEHIAQGIPGEIEDRVKRIIPLIRDWLLSHPSLGNLTNIWRASLEGSTGIRMLIYAGENFAGCEWKMNVERIIEVIHAKGE
jgi:hypothetical protein